MVRLRTAIAVALVLASPAAAEEEEEESEWVEFIVQGRGFSAFNAAPVRLLRGLPEAEVRRRLQRRIPYPAGQNFEAELGVYYYYLPRCHRTGSVPALTVHKASLFQGSLTLQCRT